MNEIWMTHLVPKKRKKERKKCLNKGNMKSNLKKLTYVNLKWNCSFLRMGLISWWKIKQWRYTLTPPNYLLVCWEWRIEHHFPFNIFEMERNEFTSSFARWMTQGLKMHDFEFTLKDQTTKTRQCLNTM